MAFLCFTCSYVFEGGPQGTYPPCPKCFSVYSVVPFNPVPVVPPTVPAATSGLNPNAPVFLPKSRSTPSPVLPSSTTANLPTVPTVETTPTAPKLQGAWLQKKPTSIFQMTEEDRLRIEKEKQEAEEARRQQALIEADRQAVDDAMKWLTTETADLAGTLPRGGPCYKKSLTYPQCSTLIARWLNQNLSDPTFLYKARPPRLKEKGKDGSEHLLAGSYVANFERYPRVAPRSAQHTSRDTDLHVIVQTETLPKGYV